MLQLKKKKEKKYDLGKQLHFNSKKFQYVLFSLSFWNSQREDKY